MMPPIANTLLHLVVLVFLPPLLPGVINKTKAWFAGRRGPPLLQPWRDIIKLCRKGMVFSRSTTAIFRLGPVLSLVAVLAAGLLVPFGGQAAPLAFAGDFVLFACLLGLSRFGTALAALDTGSAFEGMGTARDLTFAGLTEPALFLAFLVLARLTGTNSLDGMLQVGGGSYLAATAPSLVLVALGLFIILLAETCRLPVDDPNTHLELTMIHEVMVLDHSGPLLGAIEYTSAVKFLSIGAVLVNLVLPWRTGLEVLDWLVFGAGLLGLAVLTGILESVIARLRMRRVPYLLVSACLLCVSSFVLLLR